MRERYDECASRRGAEAREYGGDLTSKQDAFHPKKLRTGWMGVKPDHSAFLAQRKRRDPNRYQAVLTIG